ncbi:MAG: JAB domain-containing protein [Saccharofermentanales bacterium]
MGNKYDDAYASSFIRGLTTLTGISENKLLQYASQNNLVNVLEHPKTIDPDKQQLEKLLMLSDFISYYRLLKMQEKDSRIFLNSVAAAGDYFTSLLGGIKSHEKFVVAFLSRGGSIIETRTFSEGNVGETVVYPRMILKAALDCDCSAIILAHNHPSGSVEPSVVDIEVTGQLVSIFSPLDIPVLDHIIVGGIDSQSMAATGRMPMASADKMHYDAIDYGEKKAGKELFITNASGQRVIAEKVSLGADTQKTKSTHQMER